MSHYRYVPLVQQPFCCVPTCIQMVFARLSIPLLAQEEIGVELGLIVPEEYLEIFPQARVGDRPNSGWGTQIQLPQYSLNTFFLKRHIPLMEEYYAKPIENPSRVIREWLDNDYDVMVCFNYGYLYDDTNSNWGHVSLIESVEQDNIVLVDPEQRVPKFRKVGLKKLIRAIDIHGESNRAGFWIIKKSNEKRTIK